MPRESDDLPMSTATYLTADEAQAGLVWYHPRLAVWPTGEVLLDDVKARGTPTDSGSGCVVLERSPLWRAVRLEWVRERQPSCMACGSKVKLQVHHKRPFHLFPELELDRSNFITLCEGGRGSNCHFLIGHGCDWRRYTIEPERLAGVVLSAVTHGLLPATRASLEAIVTERLNAVLLKRDP